MICRDMDEPLSLVKYIWRNRMSVFHEVTEEMEKATFYDAAMRREHDE